MDNGGSTQHMRLHLPRSHVAHRAEAGSASGDDSSKLSPSERKLQKEITKIENEIKLLSTQCARKVRSNIATLLSGDETGKRSSTDDSSSIHTVLISVISTGLFFESRTEMSLTVTYWKFL